MHQDKQDVAPSCLSVAQCSDPSRRGLATLEQEAKQTRRPALTAPCAWRASTCAGRDEGTGFRHEQTSAHTPRDRNNGWQRFTPSHYRKF
jgi:hypothetical protein